jgi:hypothetical protein
MRLEISDNIFIVVLVVVVLIILIIWYFFVIENDEFTGFWNADPEYVKSIGVDEFIMYMAPPKKRPLKSKRYGYIVITKGKETHEQPIELDYTTPIFQMGKLGPVQMKFTKEQVFNGYKLFLDANAKNGTMVLKSDDGVIQFFKDPYLTYLMSQQVSDEE